MFEIDHRRLFRRLAGRCLRANPGRHLLVSLAVFLSTVLLFSLFTLGINYLKNLKTMMDRLDGVVSCYLYAPTQAQWEEISAMDGVTSTGLEVYLGSETVQAPSLGTVTLVHRYYDPSAWSYHILPQLSDIHGRYPQTNSEVMLSRATLARLGIAAPEIGMSIPLTETYTLSGWFTDYTGEDRVLRAQPEELDLGAESCRLGIIYPSPRTWEVLSAMPLTEQQHWELALQRSDGSAKSIAAILAVTTAVILGCGYLFLSNILALSVQHEVRFYAMLKTLGATSRQLGRLLTARAALAALLGLPTGMLVGMALCLGGVPWALEALANENMAAMPRTVDFFPAIFVGTIVFVGITLFLSCRKPARLAGRLSPIQGLCTFDVPENVKGHGCLTPHVMALRNLLRQRQKAARVVASLSLGTILTLVVNGVFHLAEPHWTHEGYEIVVQSGIYVSEEPAGAFYVSRNINQQAMEAISHLEGIAEQTALQTSELYLLPPGADAANEGAYEVSTAVTLDLQSLERYNETAAMPVDAAAFARGNMAIVYDVSGNLSDYPAMAAGNTLTVRTQNGALLPLEIVGVMCAEDYPVYTGTVSSSTYLPFLVSEDTMARIDPKANLVELKLNAAPGQLAALDKAIREIVAAAPQKIRYESAATTYAQYESDRRTLAVVGNSVSLLAVCLGLLNYIHQICSSLIIRRQELARMESLGMTRRQLCAVARQEGAFYGLFSAGVSLAVSLPLVLLGGKTADWGHFTFSLHFPARLTAGLIFSLLLLCPLISDLTCRRILRPPLLDRLDRPD